MSEETKTVITAALLIFAAAAWIWPLALGIHLEQEAPFQLTNPSCRIQSPAQTLQESSSAHKVISSMEPVQSNRPN